MIDFEHLGDELKDLLTYAGKHQNYTRGMDCYRMATVFLEDNFAKKNYKIVLHGAGGHTRKLLGLASPLLINSIVAITDGVHTGVTLGDFEVCDTAVLLDIEYDFVVMSSEVNQPTMRRELSGLGILEAKIVDIYNDKGFGKYIFSMPSEQGKVNQLAAKINASDNPILVISNNMTPVHLKLFKYLGGYFNIFVATSDPYLHGMKIDTTKDDFLFFHQFDFSADLLFLASEITKGKILTINGVYWNSLGASVLAVSKVDVISLFVDILSSAHKDIKVLDAVCDAKIQMLSEKFLWEKSAGVIFKEAIELAESNIEKYKPNKYIQFFDYCDDIVLPERKVGEVVSFVYAGGLASPNAKDHAFALQRSIFDVASVLLDGGCRFGIFNAYDHGEDSGFDIYQNTIKSDLFSYSRAVLPSQLYGELCEYDVGVILFDFAKVLDKYDFGYFKFGSSTKIIAYIEAELPIVISKEAETMASFVEQNEIGIAISWDELHLLPSMFTQESIDKYRQNIKKLKHSLSYKHQIGRLVEFIGSCHN